MTLTYEEALEYTVEQIRNYAWSHDELAGILSDTAVEVANLGGTSLLLAFGKAVSDKRERESLPSTLEVSVYLEARVQLEVGDLAESGQHRIDAVKEALDFEEYEALAYLWSEEILEGITYSPSVSVEIMGVEDVS